jgi:cytochrome c5
MNQRKAVVFIIFVLFALMVAQCTSSPATQPAAQPTASSSNSTAVQPATANVTQATALDGKALFEDRCAACHSLNRVYQEKHDATGWTRVVDQMIQKGAQASPAEEQAIVDYLTKNYGQ